MGSHAARKSPLDFAGFRRAVQHRNRQLLERHRDRTEPYDVDFAGRRLVVDPDVFCPTVGEGSRLLAEALADRAAGRVLDLGTGSAALAIVAARAAHEVVATDVSPSTVRCARRNVERLGLGDRIDVREGDLFEPLARDESFDLVVFNPPFLEGRAHDVFESSVFDENYDVLRRFFSGVGRHLAPDGAILLAFGDVGAVSYLNYLVRATSLRAERVASRAFGALEFFVLELAASR